MTKEVSDPPGVCLAVLADTHAGHPLGLMKPGQYQGVHHNFSSNKVQRIIWKRFREYADLVSSWRAGRRLVVVHNGDAIDGVHHNSTEIMSTVIPDQQGIHLAAMEWFLDTVGYTDGDSLLYVSGTPTHVRQDEEWLARDLGAEPYRKGTAAQEYKDGRYTWPHIKTSFFGVLFDIMHHSPVSAGTRYHTRGNALRSYLRSLYSFLLDMGQPLPRYWIRAHQHVPCEEVQRGRRGIIQGCLLPAWQAKTEYVYRLGVDLPAAVGGLVCQVDPDGTTRHELPYVEVEQVQEVRV